MNTIIIYLITTIIFIFILIEKNKKIRILLNDSVDENPNGLTKQERIDKLKEAFTRSESNYYYALYLLKYLEKKELKKDIRIHKDFVISDEYDETYLLLREIINDINTLSNRKEKVDILYKKLEELEQE